MGRLVSSVDELKTEMESLKVIVGKQEAFVNRWKGGAFVLMGIGAFLSWLVDNYHYIITYFK